MVTHGRLLLGVTRVLQDGNQIGDRGAEMIGEGLKVNSSLKKLYLVRLLYLFIFCLAELYCVRVVECCCFGGRCRNEFFRRCAYLP